MAKSVSPKQLARAIGVSESSVKRWCDDGVIHTSYTPGGHRKIEIDQVLQFLRNTKHAIADPEILGLPSMLGKQTWSTQEACLLYTSPSPRDRTRSRMPSSA